MSSAYSGVVKGKLSFKGDKTAVKVTKKRPIDNETPTTAEKAVKATPAEVEEIKIVPGTGRITSSGTTVHGHYTEFMNQLSPGDAIIVTHPTTLQDETKVVRMVLSNISMGISSAFSSDLISTTAFRYIKAPKDEVDEEAVAREATSKKHKSEEAAFGTYASAGGEKFVYRVKKQSAFGGYTVVTEDTNGGSKSREELLDMRKKKKSDRYVMKDFMRVV